jgi:hypothetical protein
MWLGRLALFGLRTWNQNSSVFFARENSGVQPLPVPGCKFKSRTRLPRNPSKQSAKNPLSPKNLHCIIHDTTELIHIPCLVEMVVSTSLKEDNQYVQVNHIGVHNHPKPPLIRATVELGFQHFEKPKRVPCSTGRHTLLHTLFMYVVPKTRVQHVRSATEVGFRPVERAEHQGCCRRIPARTGIRS